MHRLSTEIARNFTLMYCNILLYMIEKTNVNDFLSKFLGMLRQKRASLFFFQNIYVSIV